MIDDGGLFISIHFLAQSIGLGGAHRLRVGDALEYRGCRHTALGKPHIAHFLTTLWLRVKGTQRRVSNDCCAFTRNNSKMRTQWPSTLM
jgi:hypothetical protein